MDGEVWICGYCEERVQTFVRKDAEPLSRSSGRLKSPRFERARQASFGFPMYTSMTLADQRVTCRSLGGKNRRRRIRFY